MKIAVIGSGVAGLSTTWLLNEHSEHEVHLFEADDRVGGHTNTITFETPQAVNEQRKQDGEPLLEPTPVDTGFIVFNEVTYPNFLRFLQTVGVEIIASDMSFAVSRAALPRLPKSLPPLFGTSFPTITSSGQKLWPQASRNSLADGGRKSNGVKTNGKAIADAGALDDGKLHPELGAFEWAGGNLGSLFCQLVNVFDPAHWRMVWDIIRFNHESLVTLKKADKKVAGDASLNESIGQWLDKRGYSVSFRRNYLIPMTACIWSTPPGTAVEQFPAVTLLRFMHNHHLLQILDRPQWLTLKGGSRNYVTRILSALPPGRLHTSKTGAVQKGSARRVGTQWAFKTKDGQEHVFDKIVFATHADTSLDILDAAIDEMDPLRKALSAFKFSKNKTVTHSDERFMPVRRAAWSAWNFLAVETAQGSVDEDRVTLTYWMNLLQSLPEKQHGPVLVTLNPPENNYPAKHLIVKEQPYEHPIYTSDSVRNQQEVEKLQGSQGLYFAGAWLKYGFHEDGFSAGMRAAIALGAEAPFEPKPAEREVPSLLVETAAVSAFEQFRRVLAFASAPVLWLLILANCFVELMANAIFAAVASVGGAQRLGRCRIRNALREIRSRWEDALEGGIQQKQIW